MKAITITSVAVTALAGLSAQTSNILPASAATTSPGNFNSTVFPGSTAGAEGRTQVLYAATEVQNSGLFRSLAVRRPSNLGNQNVASSFNVQIDMSSSTVVHTAASTTYASNHGTNLATVFNGMVNLPANSSGTWPRPWETPIVFTTPFVFIASTATSLCIEFTTTGTATQPWYIEAATANTGTGTHNSNNLNQGCLHSGGAPNNSIGWSGSPTVGTTWGPVTWQNLPENNPSWNSSVLLVGTQGTGGMFGPFLLPVLLTTLGVPASNPQCLLANDVLTTLPLTYVTNAMVNRGLLRLAAIPIPNDPNLVGFNLFTQPLALDIGTMGPALWTGWGSRWNVGDGIRRGLPLTQVSRTGTGSATNPTGTVATFTGPTVQINL